MRAALVPLLIGLAGCGRVGFDLLPGKGSGPADSGASEDSSVDGPEPRETGAGGAAPVDAPDDTGPPAIIIDHDVVLDGGSSLDFGTEDGGACRIVSNGSSIRANAGWTGHVHIKNCLVRGLGTPIKPAIDIRATGTSFVLIDGSTFESSGIISVENEGLSTTTFRNNTITESSVVALDPNADNSTPAFSATGTGTANKVFSGNRLYRSGASFKSPSWLIGGTTDAEANLVIGQRASFVVGAPGIAVRGNYVHNYRFVGAQDESALRVLPEATGLVVEHNVLQRGNWVVRGMAGEFRYNAVLDTASDAWLAEPYTGAKIHHDVFVMCAAPGEDIPAGIDVTNGGVSGVEIYANTFDGGGGLMRLKGPLLAVGTSSTVASFRSNVVMRFPFHVALRGAASEPDDPPPARLGYADYNLFFNVEGASGADGGSAVRNYALSVTGRTLRTEAGFALNDARPAGPLNEQVDPALTGLPVGGACFPWNDTDVIAGRVTVSQMLSTYRGVYSPKAGSAAIGGGDPADGANAAIGAVGDGTSDSDRFGRRP